MIGNCFKSVNSELSEALKHSVLGYNIVKLLSFDNSQYIPDCDCHGRGVFGVSLRFLPFLKVPFPSCGAPVPLPVPGRRISAAGGPCPPSSAGNSCASSRGSKGSAGQAEIRPSRSNPPRASCRSGYKSSWVAVWNFSHAVGNFSQAVGIFSHAVRNFSHRREWENHRPGNGVQCRKAGR